MPQSGAWNVEGVWEPRDVNLSTVLPERETWTKVAETAGF